MVMQKMRPQKYNEKSSIGVSKMRPQKYNEKSSIGVSKITAGSFKKSYFFERSRLA